MDYEVFDINTDGQLVVGRGNTLDEALDNLEFALGNISWAELKDRESTRQLVSDATKG